MDRLRIAVALVVTLVWAFGCVVAFVVDQALSGLAIAITPVMLSVVGWLFAQEILSRRRNGKNGNASA